MRNGLTAAAVAGGTLAVVLPTVAVEAGTDGATILRLAADRATGAPVLVASVVPVPDPGEPDPRQVVVSELIKAAGLADVARLAEEGRSARAGAADCAAEPAGLGPVKPWVRAAAHFLSCLYDRPTLIGVAGRGRQSDHPTGHAVDLMATGGRGDRIAECALRNRRELGVSYVIWKQRINYGDGWHGMANRGGVTENHFDHVHISFEQSQPAGSPDASLCT